VSLFLSEFILFDVLDNFSGADEFCYFENLIDIVSSMEERGSVKDLNYQNSYHSSQYQACRPYINSVVIVGVAEKQFWTFVIKRGDMSVIFLFWEVELCQSKINYLQGFSLWIDEYVEGFDVSVHDSLRMNVIKTLNVAMIFT
jgi:hypothetical protein